MKRVAILFDNLAGGGTERVMMTLAETLAGMGHEPHVIVLDPRRDHDPPSGVPFHCLYDVRRRHLDGLFRLRRTAADLTELVRRIESDVGSFDLFLSNLDVCNRVVSRCDFSPVAYVVHCAIGPELRTELRRGPFSYLRRRRAKQALSGKRVVAVSKGIENEILSSGWIDPASITTILNPMPIDRIRRMAREPVEGMPDEPFVIHVGRVARQKRHDVLLRAFAQIDRHYRLVLLAGNVPKARKLAEREGIADRVVLPGFQRNPYAWMARAELLVLSSDFEGLGMVLLESMACGTPVVSTDCPYGPNELLTGPFARWLVPPGDPNALAERMQQALRAEIDVRNAPILAEVDAERVALKYLALVD